MKIQKNIKEKIIIQLFYICILSALLISNYSVCQAASVSITLNTDTPSVTKGDTVLVNVQLSSDARLGDFEAYITYNKDVLEFQEGASFIAGGDGLLKITDMTATGEETARKYVINFKAKKTGNCEISVKDNPEIYDYESGEIMSVSMNELSISVTAAKTASTNVNLKSLKINPGTLSPDFNKEETDYKTTVTSDTNQLIISAIAEDNSSIVTTQGNEKLNVGSNTVIVTVKAESGHTKKYKIEVLREEELQGTTEITETVDTKEENTSENSSDDDLVSRNSVTIEENGDIIYIQNSFRYQLIPLEDEQDIPEGYMKTTIIIGEEIVDAYTPVSDLNSEFLLLYAVNDKGEKGFYQYDRVEKTIQRYNKKQSNSSGKFILSDEIVQSEDYKNKITTMGIILGILGALLITMSIILIHTYTKPKD